MTSLSLLGPKGGTGPAHFQEGVIYIIRFEHITLPLHHASISAKSDGCPGEPHVSTSSLPLPLLFQALSLPSCQGPALPGEVAWLCWRKFCVAFKKTCPLTTRLLQSRAWMSYILIWVLSEADPGIRMSARNFTWEVTLWNTVRWMEKWNREEFLIQLVTSGATGA